LCNFAQTYARENQLAKQDDSTNWGALAGIGFEMLAGVGLGLVCGWWLDKKFGWSPWGTIVCTLLGTAAGMYLLIKDGMRLNRDPPDKPSGSRK
jgi:ATP synthase protein I